MTAPHLRRRRDDPLDIVRNLLAYHSRRATSLGEAQAAAYVDSRLRRAGLSVSADTFAAPTSRGITYPLLCLVGISAALLAIWLPLLALMMAVYGLVLAVSDALAAPLPALAPRHDSQNIVATRPRSRDEGAAAPQPRWRFVLLAPLDTPINDYEQRQTFLSISSPVGRILAFALLVLVLVLLAFDPRDLWRFMLALPTLYLLIGLVPPLRQRRSHASLIGGAGSLAVLLSAAEHLHSLNAVELWAVALGATETGNNGTHNLMARYPFAHHNTLFLNLQHIDFASEQLWYAPREGLAGQHAADPLLMQLVTEAATNGPYHNATEQPYYSATSIANLLHGRNYRALTLYTPQAVPQAISTNNGDDELAALDSGTLERAVQIIVQMAQQLDEESESYHQEPDRARPAQEQQQPFEPRPDDRIYYQR
jgi:disulfide bond formation protein DsbB